MERKEISKAVISRLPRYYRYLGELIEEGVERISSNELSARMKVTASQIRQDLNNFGGFGQQGYGYNVKALYEEISKILGLGIPRKTILIGAGNLGRAVTQHMDFSARGFELIGMFDVNSELIGKKIGGVEIYDSSFISEFCEKHRPSIAILCIPKEAAKELAKVLVSHGIKGFWNFSHYDLAIDYDDIAVENVHLGDSLSILCYRVHELENPLGEAPSEK